MNTGFDRETTDAVIHRLGWEALIDASVSSDEVKQGRPHPDMIFRAMELAGVQDAGQVAKVGDTVSDMREGKHAKCAYVIGITTGADDRSTLSKESPTHLIEELPELLSFFNIA